MNRVALDLGFLQIYWYTLFIFFGVFMACLVIYKEAKKQKLDMDFFTNLVFYVVIFGILGARLYYVLFNLDYYMANPIEIFQTWHGGLAIHGGILAGLAFLLFYCHKYHVNTLKLVDIIVVGLILGQVIGRWGNFFNGEAYGEVVSKAYLVKQGLPNFIIDGMYLNGAYHQPTFLYESLWNFVGFFVLLGIRHYRYLKVGFLTGLYLMWYAVIRFIIEGMRLDSLMLGPLRIAQVVSILMFLIGFFLCFIKHRKEPKLGRLYQEEAMYHKV